MIGSGGIATFPICGLTTGTDFPLRLFADDIPTREQRLLQPWAWLELYEIETSLSGTLRYVDFQDPDAGGTLATQVAFNGDDYDARKIDRGDLKTTDGVSQFTVTFEDVNRELITAVDLDDGLNTEKIHIHRIPYDLIATKPHLAATETFRIRQALASLGPDKVSFSVGLPSLADFQLPNLTISRNRCWNDFNRRFTTDSHCRYPSDDFEGGTIQTLGSDGVFSSTPTTWPSAATKRKFGWSTINADVASSWITSRQPQEAGDTKLWTICASSHDDLRWSTVQNGMYMWKDLAGDFDVDTRVINTGARAEWMNGLLLQDAVDTGDWLFWGNVENASSVEKMRVRQATAGTPTDTDFDTTDGSERIRVTRVGTTITAYSRVLEADSWVQKSAKTWTDAPTSMRIGLVVASDTVSGATSASAAFRQFLFSSGGLVSCDRSESDCDIRENLHQYNGFSGIPNQRTRG